MISSLLSTFFQITVGYDYDFDTRNDYAYDAGYAFGNLFVTLCCYAIIFLPLYVYTSYSLMKIAEKTGFGDNKILAWIPIANWYLMYQISGKEIMWFIFGFIPLLNIAAGVVIWMAIAEKLGKESYWGALTLVPVVGIIVPGYLAFSDSDSSTNQQPEQPPTTK